MIQSFRKIGVKDAPAEFLTRPTYSARISGLFQICD